MQLFHFFTCCFSSNTVIDDPPKTSYESLFDNENPRFKSFSNLETKNSNIENYYYKKDEYNNVLKDINNIQESLWKSRILTYTIRDKQVFMYYDPYKMGFTYYCSESLPYDLLNIIAMKYVRIFHCYDFFMDNKKTYLVEVTYFDTHNTEVVTITTSDIKKSMNEYQRNRKPLEYEVIDWKRERDSRMLQDERDTE